MPEGQEGPVRLSEEAICATLLDTGAVAIRDVDGGEEPFLYSSGNYGPGYVMVKGLVGRQEVFKSLVEQLALRLADDGIEFDNIAGNATGGMIPAYQCREEYQRVSGREIGYVYVRGSRKEGGHRELITGIDHISPKRTDGSPAHWLIVEELVNFAESTINSLALFRELGFVANQSAAILSYDQPDVNARLRAEDIRLTTLTTLPRLLDVAVDQGYYTADTVDSYRKFLTNPAEWQSARGIKRILR